MNDVLQRVRDVREQIQAKSRELDELMVQLFELGREYERSEQASQVTKDESGENDDIYNA